MNHHHNSLGELWASADVQKNAVQDPRPTRSGWVCRLSNPHQADCGVLARKGVRMAVHTDTYPAVHVHITYLFLCMRTWVEGEF